MKKSFIKKVVFSSSITTLLPMLAFAAPPATQFLDLTGTLQSVVTIVNSLIVIGYALAFLALIWGVTKYIFSAGDEEAKGAGQRIMIGGVIGLFVITALWGIVAFLTASSGIDPNAVGNVANFAPPKQIFQ